MILAEPPSRERRDSGLRSPARSSRIDAPGMAGRARYRIQAVVLMLFTAGALALTLAVARAASLSMTSSLLILVGVSAGAAGAVLGLRMARANHAVVAVGIPTGRVHAKRVFLTAFGVAVSLSLLRLLDSGLAFLSLFAALDAILGALSAYLLKLHRFERRRSARICITKYENGNIAPCVGDTEKGMSNRE